MPIEQYRKDGRIIRGLQRGAASFGTSTASAALELSNRLVQAIQVCTCAHPGTHKYMHAHTGKYRHKHTCREARVCTRTLTHTHAHTLHNDLHVVSKQIFSSANTRRSSCYTFGRIFDYMFIT